MRQYLIKKILTFKKSFFHFSLIVDLNDINNFIYADLLTLAKSIKKINKAIVTLKADKVFKTNQIFNRMLKRLRKTVTKIKIYISSMHRRRISFEIIPRNENYNTQKNQKKMITQFSKFTNQLHC